MALLAVLFVGQPVLAAPQICENERQQVIAATKGQNKANIDDVIGWVQSTIHNGNNWCPAFKGDPKSPEYGRALKTCADAHDVNAQKDTSEYRAVRLPQYKLFSCVARYLANPQQVAQSPAQPPNQPLSQQTIAPSPAAAQPQGAELPRSRAMQQSPASERPKVDLIRVVRREGNRCITAKVGKVDEGTVPGNYWVEVLFENKCKRAQLLAAVIAHEPTPDFYSRFPHTGITPVPTMGWANSSPAEQLGYGQYLHGPAVAFPILAGETAVVQGVPGMRLRNGRLITSVQMGACDLYDERDFEQTAFRNAAGFTIDGFMCLPNRFSENARIFDRRR